MPNRDLPVSDMQVLALDVEVAFAEAALVTEVRGLSPGPATAVDEAQGAGRAQHSIGPGPCGSLPPEVASALRACAEFAALMRGVSGRARDVGRSLPGSCGATASPSPTSP
jgi:hypothetical protein